jgi:hypothetical protein
MTATAKPGTKLSRWRMRLVFLALLATVLAAEAAALFLPTLGVRAAGQRPYVIQELAAGVPVGETFRIPGDAVESVDLELSSTGPASIAIACRLLGWADYALSDGSGRWAAIYDWKMTLTLPGGRSRHHFTFQPISPSTNTVFQFQVQQLDVRSLDPTHPGRPMVGVMASEDDSFAGGNLIVGKEQMVNRDLFFEAHTASAFTQFRLHAGPLLPRPLRSRATQLGLLGLYNWALSLLAFHMIIRAPEQDEHDRQERLPS